MSQFICPSCRGNCCTCNGCQAAVTSRGTQCCNRCYLGVERTENAQAMEQLQRQVDDINNRPSERLYINGV